MKQDQDCLYTYKAIVDRIVDGDTVDLSLDLGLNVWVKERVRLARINAPERRGIERPEGIKSTDYLSSLIDGEEVLIQTIKDKKGKYGRYLAEIFSDGVNINDRMVADGFAKYQSY